jgi:hypothetical protein
MPGPGNDDSAEEKVSWSNGGEYSNSGVISTRGKEWWKK